MHAQRRVEHRGSPSTCSGRRARRGSGLILALGVLAMLAIIATTFVTMTRVETRIARIALDDLTTTMLARGVMRYCLAVLRDDQDRTLFKYENRDTSVGGRSQYQSMKYLANGSWVTYAPGDSRAVTDYRMSIGGRNTDYLAPEKYRYGTPASNDVWFHSASEGYPQTGLYEGSPGHYEWAQPSFGGGTGSNYDFCIVDRDDKPILDPDEQAKPDHYYSFNPCHFNGRDDNRDGQTDPNYRWGRCDDSNCPRCAAGQFHWYFPRAASREWGFVGNYLYDATSFLTHGYNCYLHPGRALAGSSHLRGGLVWRWAAKMGVPEERYVNLNVAGNNEMLVGTQRLNNLDGRDLHARRGDVTTAPSHLGLIGWKGYPGEYEYAQGGFNDWYNPVRYAPCQLDPYRVLAVDFCHIPGYANYPDIIQYVYGHRRLDPAETGEMAPEWVRKRWGDDGLPADGGDRWRPGWRRDGATYYKIPTPDRALGDDHYFGATEALNHQSEDIVVGTSRVFDAVLSSQRGDLAKARHKFGRTRAYLSTFGCDTMLRGKIWPEEGWLPWRTSGTAGDWRHIDILRRVNLNMLGAPGREGLHNEDGALKDRWRNQRLRERDRLYLMLRAYLRFTNTPNPEHEACQLVASLTDMVDRDQTETLYTPPDAGTVSGAIAAGHWALGVEKHPVLNEIAVFLRDAKQAEYETFRLRVELYNPFENIPWIPDADEGFDVSDYALKIGTRVYRVGDLTHFGTDPNTVIAANAATIGADGIYARPQAVGVLNHQTWSRFMHLGWNHAAVGIGWPLGLTREEINAPIVFSLWKPLSVDSDDGAPGTYLPVDGQKVADLTPLNHPARRYMCVDRTPEIRLVKPFTPPEGPGVTRNRFIGIYRRWDPMNAHVYGTEGTDERSNVLWCPGYNIVNYPTLGRPNTGYVKDASSTFPEYTSGTSPYQYERRFEVNYKIPDSDLPSVGWLGELFLHNAAQDGPLSWVPTGGQEPAIRDNFPRYNRYRNIIETVKLDLFRPWGKPHNLHLYDMFTVQDPMNDGIDNDGDGAIDDEDTGRQSGDLLGPEVRIYGVVDINHVGVRVLATTMTGYKVPYFYSILSEYGPHRERGHANHVSRDGSCMGPWDSIGQILTWDDLLKNPGWTLGHFTHWSANNAPAYTSAVNLVGQTIQDHWGTGWCPNADDDGDGIKDERDERDFFFTHAANYLTTRSHNFTVEIVTQVVDPFEYPGRNYGRGCYQSEHVYAEKHLILLVDRSTTLRIGPNKTCDFTGTHRIHALRWAHERK